MHEPNFKPNHWVLYEMPQGVAGFGQNVGGRYTNGAWNYQVKGATPNDDNVEVPQDTISFVLENGNWTAPQHFGGSSSAYADISVVE